MINIRCITYILLLLLIGTITVSITALADNIDYVVITTDDYDDAFQNLTNWKETRGTWTIRTNLTTHIELLSNITSNSSFWDGGYHDISPDNTTKSQIRNYVNFTYTNHSTQYILLGANASVIPTDRTTYIYGGEYMKAYDFWYGNVSTEEGYEVYIGRLPCNNTTQVDVYSSRLEIYENCTNESWATTHIKTAANGVGGYQDTIDGDEQLTTIKYYHRDKGLSVIFTENESGQFFTFGGHGDSDKDYEERKASLYPNEQFAEHGYNNLTFPYIHITTGCKQGQLVDSSEFSHNKYRELLMGGPNIDNNRTAILHLGSDCLTSLSTSIFRTFLEDVIEALLVKTAPHLGTSVGEVFANNFYSGYNIMGCPEVTAYIYENNITADINEPLQETTDTCYGPKDITNNNFINSSSYWLNNKTITGTATGTNFSNYSLQLLWWDDYTFISYMHTIIGYDVNPNSTLFTPPNSLYCFDIPDPDTPVENGVLGTLNTSMVAWKPKGVYCILLTVNSTTGSSITKETYFLGPSYVEGIIKQNGVQVSAGTDINITYYLANISSLESLEQDKGYTTTTIQTKNVDGNTGYYNFSFWENDIRPSQKYNTFSHLFYSNITVSYEQETNTTTYYIPKDPAYYTLNIDKLITLYNEYPTNNSIDHNTSLNISIVIEAMSGSFNWTIECNNTQNNSANDDTNGTKNCTLTNLNYNTTYTWWVNITDGTNTINRTYRFKTLGVFANNICVEYSTGNFDAQPYAESVIYIAGVFMLLSSLLMFVVIISKYRV